MSDHIEHSCPICGNLTCHPDFHANQNMNQILPDIDITIPERRLLPGGDLRGEPFFPELYLAVDFDGTLAEARKGEFLGQAVPAMLARVKWWRKEGIRVRILTARGNPANQKQYDHWCLNARIWLERYFTPDELEHISWTDKKCHRMVALFDDRAYHVFRDTGNVHVPLPVEVSAQASIHVSEAPEPATDPATILRQAADLFEDRNGTYGSAYLRFGDVMSALYPHGLMITPGDTKAFAKLGVLVQIMNKTLRATAGQPGDVGNPDDPRDAIVYNAMLQSLLLNNEPHQS